MSHKTHEHNGFSGNFTTADTLQPRSYKLKSVSCLNKDTKIQMSQNIKLHKQRLLRLLENINDTYLKPKIKLVPNDIKKSNLNHNVKPTIASSTEFQKPKFTQSTISVINFKDKSKIRVKTYEPVLNTKAKNLEASTGIDVKKGKSTSNISVNQLRPNVKVNKREEPLSDVKLKLEPSPNIEIKDTKSPVIKKLKEQLIEELFDSSSSEEIDDNISVGNNEDWNEIFQTHNENKIFAVGSNSRLKEGIQYDEHEQLAKDKSEKYLYYSGNSENPVLDIHYPTTGKTGKISRTRKIMILTKPEYRSTHRFRKPLDRSIHNAKERACRERIAKRFDILRKCCSYLNTTRRVPSKHSILLAAKKECDLLNHFEKKMVAEKKVWRKANEVLKKRIAEFYRNNYENNKLACLN